MGGFFVENYNPERSRRKHRKEVLNMEKEIGCLVKLGRDCSECKLLEPRTIKTDSSAETYPLRENIGCPNPEIMKWPRREKIRHW